MVLVGHDGLVNRLCDEVSTIILGSCIRAHSLFPRSVKWVGLFVTALVGLYTIEDLWDKFGDLKMTWVCLILHNTHTSELTRIP